MKQLASNPPYIVSRDFNALYPVSSPLSTPLSQWTKKAAIYLQCPKSKSDIWLDSERDGYSTPGIPR
jgi:hypothetical protein